MSSDVHSILVGETWRKASMVAKASGSAITSGTVNYYLKCLTGTNAGKWWKNSDQTWDASETANAMTHQADGGWSITLAASPFTDGVLYYEYAKESGDLHVAAEGRLLRGKAVVDQVDATKVGGVTQTGRDLGASVLLAADQAVNATKIGGVIVNGPAVGEIYMPNRFAAPLSQSSPIPIANRPKLLVSNDWGGDLDGAFALAMLGHWQTLGLCELVGCLAETNLRDSDKLIDAILSFYGISSVPIGKAAGSTATPLLFGLDNLINACPQLNGVYGEAVAVARQALADAEDGSVTILTMGKLTNLANVFASEADYGGDGLGTGLSLITAKVARILIGGGVIGEEYTEQYETNLDYDPEAAQAVLAACPAAIPVIFVGEDCGSPYGGDGEIILPDPSQWSTTNPLRYMSQGAYDFLAHGEYTWESYDSVRVFYAVFGLGDFLELSAAGTASVSNDGILTHVEGEGNHYYALRSANMTDAEVGVMLGRLIEEAGYPRLPPTAEENAAAARVELATELAYLDAAISDVPTVEEIQASAEAAIAAAGLSSSSSGDGDTSVDHDTGGTDALAYKTAGGSGIDNATIKAFLKSDYDADLRVDSYMKARTVTNSYGRWTNPMMLDAGETYTLVFYKAGVCGPDTTEITVAE